VPNGLVSVFVVVGVFVFCVFGVLVHDLVLRDGRGRGRCFVVLLLTSRFQI
jgi:hypothetical protein